MGLLSRNKGHAWEREVARRFREIFPDAQIHRASQAREGADGADVAGVPRFWIECKHQRQPSADAALRQARSACGAGDWPIAVVKRNRQAPYVCMEFEDFLTLIREWADNDRGTPQ
jgi:hypothetical protein